VASAIIFEPPAKKGLDAIPDRFRAQIIRRVAALGSDPHPAGSIKLRGTWGRYGEEAYRIRSGNYRIIYTIRGQTVAVLVVDDRKDVYK
jgi:mRNA-degrading endonuclease RelE of RelBE toxin-antitoxin system